MMQEMTPAELKSSELEIKDEARDTPQTVGVHKATRVIYGFAMTTQILNPSCSAFNDYVLFSRNMTGASEEQILQEAEIQATADASQAVAGPSPLGDADAANRDRLELLARSYVAGQLSPEENARLAIVTERVRRLIPRVTANDFEELQRMAEDVRRIDAEDNDRRIRLGLR